MRNYGKGAVANKIRNRPYPFIFNPILLNLT